MVRRWHCLSGPWHFCLMTDMRMICPEHPQDLLVPSHMLSICPDVQALQPVLRHTLKPALLGGQQESCMEEGGGQATLLRV